MLRELRIINIVLIESVEIFFEAGLNVITGETGAGKSAILHALSLIMGSRADSNVIRKGKDKGAVEAYFEKVIEGSLQKLLDDAGISYEDDSGLIIRREISHNGKSRAFINQQLVQLSFLKSVGAYLLDIVSQHASRHLLSLEAHREIVDLYGVLADDVATFARSWELEIELQRKLKALIEGESQRLREIEGCLRELEELQEASLKEGEDEEIFAEYSLLMNSEELSNKSGDILRALDGEKISVMQLLNRHKRGFEGLVRLDPTLAPALEAFNGATVEIKEIVYTLSTYHSRIVCNPSRCHQLNERLTLIALLKRKYGSSISEIQEYQKKLIERIVELENGDTNIENFKLELINVAETNQKLASQLTSKRQAAAKAFGLEMVRQLVSLNMPKVEFQVEVSSQKRSAIGDDVVEFFLLPNVGERRIPIKDCASGGEISRILLALHVVLAGKQEIPTLIFDEIDEGVGGKTASLLGEKLREISKNHQVFCITHFPQVAKYATLHLQISKSEKNGRTSTEIQILDEATRHYEISRMLGEEPVHTFK
ncbi:MAG: DNA repair protein RecN [Parachlamydiaceae bacterium]|nr:DNA repair protein RecN [Parachlamydiaceae bacterium]